MNTQTLQLKQIRIDGGTQPRVEINEEVVAEYAEQLREGVVFPPVVVFFDGAAYWLADGFHRYHSHRRAGRDTINTDLRDGGLRDAILHSVGANTEHGLRRTNEDKRKAVETMLTNEIVSKDEKGIPLSDRDIARFCQVHHSTVSRIRQDHTVAKRQYETEQRTFTHHKTGQPAIMNTGNIGKSQQKARKQYGGIAPNAFTPVRSGEKYQSRAAIELPYDPVFAANAIISTMGDEMAIEIAQQILQLAKGN